MPDDFDATAVSGKEEARKSSDFDRFCTDLRIRAKNPWYPSTFSWFGPEQEKHEREVIRAAIEKSAGDARAISRLVNLHIGDAGNHKLPANYLTFNMTSGHGCPSLSWRGDGSLDMSRTTCQAFTPDGNLDCYAIRDEQNGLKKMVWRYRTRQNELWQSLLKRDPDIMVATVLQMVMDAHKIPKYALRFSVAGDFPDQASVDAFLYIAAQLGHLVSTPASWGLPFMTYTYTARQRLNFRAARKVPTAVIMGSNMSVGHYPGITGTFKYIMSEDDAPNEQGSGPRYGMNPSRQWSICHGEFKDVPAGKYGCRGCRRCLLGLNSVVVRHTPMGQEDIPLGRAVYVSRGER
jgi:hypothetical protein